jgi:hypothetical protein
MILWPQPDGSTIATPQPAHAIIAGQLMRALADRPEPFEPAVTAAIEHDCPWQSWEMAPEFDSATGLPRLFNSLSGDEHVPMWEQGVRMALANWGLLVGLLVMRHGSHIYRLGILGNRIAPSAISLAAMEGYMAREREQGAAIMARLGMTEAEVAALSAKLALVDSIALSLCWGAQTFQCGPALLTRSGPYAATISPWPFDVPAISVATEALHITAPFDSETAMRAAWPDLPRRMLRFTLSAA